MFENKLSFLKSQKNEKRLEISELPKKIPDFKNSFESKDILISKWIKDWIKNAEKTGSSIANYLLPKKADMAHYLGVSVGTVQNAIRYVEDEGYLQSKQRIGTTIVDMSNPVNTVKKLTSRREKVIIEIKKYIIKNNYRVGEFLPSSRKLAEIFNASSNITRLAMEHLCSIGMIESRYTRGVEANWVLKELPDIDRKFATKAIDIKADTLVEKIEKDLKSYIAKNLSVGDKLPAHQYLAQEIGVSVKTIHDAMKMLVNEGILLARRGKYGTFVLKMPYESALEPKKEHSIFASAEDAIFYSYQKIENKIKSMIKENYNVGDKLPTMETFSKELDVSTSTIKKALQNLADDGYITFLRGKYGGTFVVELPEEPQMQSFKWLAVNPQYSPNYQKK